MPQGRSGHSCRSSALRLRSAGVRRVRRLGPRCAYMLRRSHYAVRARITSLGSHKLLLVRAQMLNSGELAVQLKSRTPLDHATLVLQPTTSQGSQVALETAVSQRGRYALAIGTVPGHLAPAEWILGLRTSRHVVYPICGRPEAVDLRPSGTTEQRPDTLARGCTDLLGRLVLTDLRPEPGHLPHAATFGIGTVTFRWEEPDGESTLLLRAPSGAEVQVGVLGSPGPTRTAVLDVESLIAEDSTTWTAYIRDLKGVHPLRLSSAVSPRTDRTPRISSTRVLCTDGNARLFKIRYNDNHGLTLVVGRV